MSETGLREMLIAIGVSMSLVFASAIWGYQMGIKHADKRVYLDGYSDGFKQGVLRWLEPPPTTKGEGSDDTRET